MSLSLISLFIFFSSICHGVLGFGFNITLTLLLFSLLSLPEIFSLGITFALIVNIPNLIYYFKSIDFRLFLILLIGGILGVMPGLFLFFFLSESVLKILVLIIYALVLVLLVCMPFNRLTFNQKNNFYIGVFSGFIGGLMCLPGLILSLFLNQKDIKKKQFKGTLSLFFFLIDLIIFLVYFKYGIITSTSLSSYISYLPLVIFGLLFGILLTRYFSENMFKKVVYYFLFVGVILNFLIITFV